jgi:hypothetical protein
MNYLCFTCKSFHNLQRKTRLTTALGQRVGAERRDISAEQCDTGAEQCDTGAEQCDTGAEQCDTSAEQCDTQAEGPSGARKRSSCRNMCRTSYFGVKMVLSYVPQNSWRHV